QRRPGRRGGAAVCRPRRVGAGNTASGVGPEDPGGVASGCRTAGSAVLVQRAGRSVDRGTERRRTAAAGGTGRGDRSTEPGRDDPFRGGIRRARCAAAAAAQRRDDRGRLAQQRRYGCPTASGGGNEPDTATPCLRRRGVDARRV